MSELFFQLKQAFDDFIVTLLSTVMDEEWARVLGIVVSVNVLTGFVASLYAALIAAVVRARSGGCRDGERCKSATQRFSERQWPAQLRHRRSIRHSHNIYYGK